MFDFGYSTENVFKIGLKLGDGVPTVYPAICGLQPKDINKKTQTEINKV